jgi:asparagine synthase (glutamine-hydrolysing)
MPAPWSGWAGIERLRPSELAVASDQGLQRRAYWKLELAQRSDLPEAEHVRRLRQALEESVADVLAGVSDPLFCMSGGIDSTAIAAIGRRMLGRKIRTVCLGFSPEEKDDRPYARRAAEFVDTDHSEVMITPEKVGEHLERIADVLEVPSVLSYCEFLLSLQVAGGTRLLVTGETADSQFGGTSPFIFLRQLAMYQKVPRPMRRGLAGMLKAIFRPDAVLFGKHPGLIVRLLDDADRASEVQRYLTIRRYFNYEDVCRLLPQGAIGKGDVEEYLETIGRPYHGRPMDAMLAFHLRHEAANEYLADDLKLPCPLVYRSPYTSQRMVKLSSAMPIGLKVRGAIRKYALIEAVKDILPPEAITRKKMGFGLPLDEWLWGPLRDLVRENLSAASLPAFLNADEVVRIRDAFLGSKERMYFRETWLLLTVAMWARKHLAGA